MNGFLEKNYLVKWLMKKKCEKVECQKYYSEGTSGSDNFTSNFY